jgi:hypothetical protein
MEDCAREAQFSIFMIKTSFLLLNVMSRLFYFVQNVCL